MAKYKQLIRSGRQIDPKSNFLLVRAQELSKRKDETSSQTLYLLHNGVYAVHVRYKNKHRSDELLKIEQAKAITEFQLNVA
jgi:hypothetical protein